MAFSYTGFRIYGRDGSVLCETELPDPQRIYDQQFRRDENRSYLEVFYYDGAILRYDAADGTLFEQDSGTRPRRTCTRSLKPILCGSNHLCTAVRQRMTKPQERKSHGWMRTLPDLCDPGG